MFSTLTDPSLELFLIGELKAFWTLPLEALGINQDPESVTTLEPHIGG